MDIADRVPIEVPSSQPPSLLAFTPRPRIPIHKRAEDREIPNGENYNNCRDLETPAWTQRRRQEVEYRAKQ